MAGGGGGWRGGGRGCGVGGKHQYCTSGQPAALNFACNKRGASYTQQQQHEVVVVVK